ncbi:MAG TPA: LytR C-terminal domain-containing protein [Micromonosporaceae bacterium]
MSLARARALAIVGVLGLAAVVLVVVALVKDKQSTATAAGECPPGAVKVSLKLPEARNVKVRVLNGTGRTGLGSQVSDDFANRKFQVQKPGNAKAYDGVAIIRYGPKTVGGAWLLRAYFLNEADTQFDVKRTDDVVDVVIGSSFQQLGTSTEVNQSIAQLGNPVAPPGTCEATRS